MNTLLFVAVPSGATAEVARGHVKAGLQAGNGALLRFKLSAHVPADIV